MMFGRDQSASTDGQWFEGDDRVDMDRNRVTDTGSVVVLHAKDMVMIGLVLAAIVLMVVCCGMRSRREHKYQRVVMNTESEIENFSV